ncbi:MAG: uroporphyrinogen decarboxylase family protein [Rikenellaceae bacterium]
MIVCGCNLFEWGTFLRRMDNFLMDTLCERASVETVGTLNSGSREQIREQIFERLEIMSKGGGFVFNTVHNIMPDVPAENIITMYEAVKEWNDKNSKR